MQSTTTKKASEAKENTKTTALFDYKKVARATERLDRETKKPNDSAKAKVAKDRAYLLRLQRTIQGIVKQAKKASSEDEKRFLRYFEEYVIKQVWVLGEEIYKKTLYFYNADIAQRTLTIFTRNICEGKYNGGGVSGYLKQIQLRMVREDFREENGLGDTERRVAHAISVLEDEIAKNTGRSPEDITEKERYDYLLKKGYCKSVAEEFKNRTYDSFKLKLYGISVEDEGKYKEDEYSYIENDDPRSFLRQFDAERIARNPVQNQILIEAIKEGWDEEDIINAGVYLMHLGYQLKASESKYMKNTITGFWTCFADYILEFYKKVTGEDPYKISKDKVIRARSIVKKSLKALEDPEKKRDLKQIIALKFADEAGDYIRGELYSTVFD